MQYVYVLKSKKDDQLYIGCTKDLKTRVALHNAKKVPATTSRTPLDLIYYEAFMNISDAFAREQYLKTGWGRNQLHRLLRNFLDN